MKLLPNVGHDRVIDSLRNVVPKDATLDMATPQFSIFAFADMRDWLAKLKSCRVVLPNEAELCLLGGDADRSRRNRLTTSSIAAACHAWFNANAAVRTAPTMLSQCVLSASR